MRNAIIIFIFQLLFLGPAYGQAPEKRFVGNCSFSGFALVSDSTYRGNITRFDDRMGDGYNLTQLATGYEIFDGRGLVFSIGTIHSSTNFTADVTVTAKVNRGFEPFGSGQVYYPTANGLIPPSSQEQAGLSPTQKARIDRHNVVTMQSLIGGRDSVYSITNVPDTSALTPVMGDIFVNAAGDTLGVYNTSWVLFFGGGSAETADGLTILGDGTGGDPFRVDTALIATTTALNDSVANVQTLIDSLSGIKISFNYLSNIQIKTCETTAPFFVTGRIDDPSISVGDDISGDITWTLAGTAVTYIQEEDGWAYYEIFGNLSAGVSGPTFGYGGVTLNPLISVLAGFQDTVTVFDPPGQDSILVTRVCGTEVSRDTLFNIGSMTEGSILFVGPDQRPDENNTELFWDDDNKWMGLGTNDPKSILDVTRDANQSIVMQVLNENTGTAALSRLSVSNGVAKSLTLSKYGANFSGFTWDGNSLGGWGSLYLDSQGSGLFMGAASDVPILFGNNATERLRIHPGGNIGIRKTSPAYSLDIGSTSAALRLNPHATSLTNSAGVLTYNSTNNWFLGRDGVNEFYFPKTSVSGGNFTGNSILFGLANGAIGQNNSKLVFDLATGYVGIGTGSPSSLLHVKTDISGPTLTKIENVSTGSNAYSGISLISNSSGTGYAAMTLYNPNFTTTPAFQNRFVMFIGSAVANGLLFYAQSGGITCAASGISNPDLRISATGNIGINELSPDARLEVVGDAIITSTLYLDAAKTVGIFRGTGSPESSVTASVGSTYHRTDGGAGTSFYVKESGTGNTGWVAK